MKAPLVLLCVIGACGLPRAQQVPDITDVYTNVPPAERTTLGPSADPHEITARYAACMRECERLVYSATVSLSEASGEETPVFRGLVTIDRGEGGSLERMRIDPVESGDSGSAGRDGLERFARITGLEGGAEPVLVHRPAGGVAGRWLHFVDETLGEHVYVAFADEDGMPRVIERLVPGTGAAPVLVRTRIENLREER